MQVRIKCIWKNEMADKIKNWHINININHLIQFKTQLYIVCADRVIRSALFHFILVSLLIVFCLADIHVHIGWSLISFSLKKAIIFFFFFVLSEKDGKRVGIYILSISTNLSVKAAFQTCTQHTNTHI